MTPAFGEPLPPISLEEFRLIRDVIADFCGVYLNENNSERFRRKLYPRLIEHQIDSFGDYYRYLKFNRNRREELTRIADLIVNNETYFFREDYQLKAFSREILPELHEKARTGRRLNIWSAGCSTGEEPLTLAILVKESGLFADWDVKIFGTDISQKAITKARRGLYGPSSFRFPDKNQEVRIKRAYFQKTSEGFQIKKEIQSMVSLLRANIIQSEELAPLGNLDVIFCRNVFIYFPEETRFGVVEMFYNKLKSGGYLLLGHSENILNTSTAFSCVRLSNDLVYRKPSVQAPPTQER